MEDKQEQEVKAPRSKRRVSLFRRRKKPEIRPLIREKKKRQYKKYFIYGGVFLILIFSLSAILYLTRQLVIPKIFNHHETLLNPQGKQMPDNEEIRQMLASSGLEISNTSFATSSAVVQFVLSEKTTVYILSSKDIKEQIALVEAIDRQIIADGKQAILIDLRYNKPIVKF